MKYLNCFSYTLLFFKLLYAFALKFHKLINYNTNQGFDKRIIGNPEPFWVCFTFAAFYIFCLILMLSFKKIEYGVVIVRVIGIFLIGLILLLEFIGHFNYREEVNIENLLFTAIIFIFILTCAHDLCWSIFFDKIKNF